jgi:hypothetical protein
MFSLLFHFFWLVLIFVNMNCLINCNFISLLYLLCASTQEKEGYLTVSTLNSYQLLDFTLISMQSDVK